ncbi:single-stranded DNA-binding protein [Herbihabitans rhizosphaerae]|uniref:single-stranded DNA-binding protein n=1 Tax=Herbihabitans rhizosphaerae TaxID=1872711 RepID=UPI00102ADEA4|nr:single-stranded DNA-binding protein [Herbihabitans rhizosphaerae]
MNEVGMTLVGNVVSDVRTKTTMAGDEVVSFRAASTERRYDKETGQWVDGNKVYVNVSCWRKLGSGVYASLRKGDPIVATGRFYIREYETEGERRSSAELEARAVGPDLSRSTAQVVRNSAVHERAVPERGVTERVAPERAALAEAA